MWRLWQIHPPVVLIVRASKESCLQTLAAAAKPSLERLHLRDLFAEGRRYYIQPHKDGFKMTYNTRGERRQRAPFAAVVYGSLASLSEDVTCIRLHARIRWFYLFTAAFVPAWMSYIILSTAWSRIVTLALVVALFELSIVGHLLNAALQAREMVYFVRKALEDLPTPSDLTALPTGKEAEVVTHPNSREFRQQWQKFYETHQDGR